MAETEQKTAEREQMSAEGQDIRQEPAEEKAVRQRSAEQKPAKQKPAKQKSAKKKSDRASESAGQKKSGKSRSGGSSKASGNAARSKKRAAVRRGGKSTSQTIAKSFGHAFDGILFGLDERNMKIHCTMAVLVVFFGLVLHISVSEWCTCFGLFGLVMGLELVNTAIEAVVDLVTDEFKPLAKRAKDAAAGAVLIAAIMAAVAGLIIFIPRFLYLIRSI